MSIIFNENFFKKLGTIKLSKPTGQLSGHNSGEPFSEEIYKFLKKNSKKIYKQYEYLNNVLKKNIHYQTLDDRKKLFKGPFNKLMIYKKEATIKKWSINNLISEKQDDTADILYIDNKTNGIIDVKTRNLNKKGQAPNIISCEKLAIFCKNLIKEENYEKIEINYIGIDWDLKKNEMISNKINVVDLFKINPETIYINWAAALQIQFHIDKVDQTYKKNKKQWAKDFTKKYVSSYKNRQKKQDEKMKPFIELIKD